MTSEPGGLLVRFIGRAGEGHFLCVHGACFIPPQGQKQGATGSYRRFNFLALDPSGQHHFVIAAQQLSELRYVPNGDNATHLSPGFRILCDAQLRSVLSLSTEEYLRPAENPVDRQTSTSALRSQCRAGCQPKHSHPFPAVSEASWKKLNLGRQPEQISPARLRISPPTSNNSLAQAIDSFHGSA
jgi:hypothetical protein